MKRRNKQNVKQMIKVKSTEFRMLMVDAREKKKLERVKCIRTYEHMYRQIRARACVCV